LVGQPSGGGIAGDEARRWNARQELKKALDEIRSAAGESFTMDDIGAAIKAARAEGRARESRL
jgi:hypothetical protein